MPKFTDTHAHIYKEYYKDIDEVISTSRELGIETIINDGDNYDSNKEMLELCKKYSNMYITLGFHPEFASEVKDEELLIISENISNPKVVAIGEIGLDYHYETYDKKKQIELFEHQLSLAEKYNMPVVVHSREATLDTLNSIKKYNVKGVIHCFSGSLEIAKEYIKLGFLLGIGGTVTYKNNKLINIIKEIGLENIVLETDSPFLTPEPFRGKKNIPGNVKYVSEFLSNNLKIDVEKISEITEKNVLKIFKKIKKV